MIARRRPELVEIALGRVELADQALADGHTAVLALDLSGVFDLEYTALKMLDEAEKRTGERGVALWLVGLNPQALDAVIREHPELWEEHRRQTIDHTEDANARALYSKKQA